jgi:hypothetical protein
MNGYQLDDLIGVLEEIQEAVPGFDSWIDFTGDLEATMQGNLPTVICGINYQGNESELNPLPIVVVRTTLAALLRQKFAAIMTDALEALIAQAENCPITQ